MVPGVTWDGQNCREWLLYVGMTIINTVCHPETTYVPHNSRVTLGVRWVHGLHAGTDHPGQHRNHWLEGVKIRDFQCKKYGFSMIVNRHRDFMGNHGTHTRHYAPEMTRSVYYGHSNIQHTFPMGSGRPRTSQWQSRLKWSFFYTLSTEVSQLQNRAHMIDVEFYCGFNKLGFKSWKQKQTA